MREDLFFFGGVGMGFGIAGTHPYVQVAGFLVATVCAFALSNLKRKP